MAVYTGEEAFILMGIRFAVEEMFYGSAAKSKKLEKKQDDPKAARQMFDLGNRVEEMRRVMVAIKQGRIAILPPPTEQ